MYPAGHPGIRARRIRLRTGVTLRVLDAGPEEGEPVLLLHGWGACAYMHRFAIDALAGAGWRALALDQRGHGLSEKPIGPDGLYTLDRLLDDLDAAADELGLRRYAVIGQSMGGKVALCHALRHPERVRAAALISPAGLCPIPAANRGRRMSPRLLDHFARLMVPRALVSVLLRMTYGDPSRVTERDVDEYWAPSQFPDYARAMRALICEFDWRPLPDDALARLRTPTMVIVGTRDRLLRGAPGAARRIPGAEALIVNGGGHDVNEEYHEVVNEALVRFLHAH